MSRRHAIAAAALLPLAGLAALWWQADQTSRHGVEWDIPIRGFDPRDYLRGHYVQFQYDWPGHDRTREPFAADDLCLAGQPPRLDRVTHPASAADAAAGGRPCPHWVRGVSRFGDGPGGSVGGRLYAPADRARELERKLADPALQGLVRVRLRPDGVLTPLDITFRPKAPAPKPPAKPAG